MFASVAGSASLTSGGGMSLNLTQVICPLYVNRGGGFPGYFFPIFSGQVGETTTQKTSRTPRQQAEQRHRREAVVAQMMESDLEAYVNTKMEEHDRRDILGPLFRTN